MGHLDDDYFVRRYKEGEKEVFFAINSDDDGPWTEAFWKVVQEQGLRPIFYGGAGRDIIPPAGRSNTLNDEMMSDFHPAKTKVAYFGDLNEESDHEDHWILNKLSRIPSGHILLVYVSKDYPVEVLRRHGFKANPIVVADPKEFAESLRKEIAAK
jgi:hypothetical protein